MKRPSAFLIRLPALIPKVHLLLLRKMPYAATMLNRNHLGTKMRYTWKSGATDTSTGSLTACTTARSRWLRASVAAGRRTCSASSTSACARRALTTSTSSRSRSTSRRTPPSAPLLRCPPACARAVLRSSRRGPVHHLARGAQEPGCPAPALRRAQRASAHEQRRRVRGGEQLEAPLA